MHTLRKRTKRLSNLRPFKPDAEEFQVHDTEVGDGEGKQVDGRADGAHLTARQHDKVETVGHRAGHDDRPEAEPDRVQDGTQPRVRRRVILPDSTCRVRPVIRLIGRVDHLRRRRSTELWLELS